MKKRFSTILLFLLAAVLCISFPLTACARQEIPKHVTLSIMGKTSDLEKSYMTRIFELYESATGNKMKLIKIEDTKFDDAVEKAFDKNNTPDLLMHFNNSDLNELMDSNQFLFLNNEDWADDLTDSSKAYCQDSEGNLLGLPFWENSISGCYYNKTLLDSLGLKPARTQADFNALCQALTDIGYTPLCWAEDGGNWVYQFALDPVFADNPNLLEQLNCGEVSYADIPAVTDMVSWINHAAHCGWLGKAFLTNSWDDLSANMSSGKAVMIFIWDTWFYTDFKSADGEGYTKEDFALMPVFMNTADSGTYEGGNLNIMMVNQSGQVDAALDFLEFCASAENYNRAFDGIATVNCFQGQTTNIQSDMVTDAMPSIMEYQRVSTAEPKIIGYRPADMSAAMRELFQGNVNIAGCVDLMDSYRIAAASKLT